MLSRSCRETMQMIWLFLSVLGRMRKYGVENSEHGILTGQF